MRHPDRYWRKYIRGCWRGHPDGFVPASLSPSAYNLQPIHKPSPRLPTISQPHHVSLVCSLPSPRPVWLVSMRVSYSLCAEHPDGHNHRHRAKRLWSVRNCGANKISTKATAPPAAAPATATAAAAPLAATRHRSPAPSPRYQSTPHSPAPASKSRWEDNARPRFLPWMMELDKERNCEC